MRVHVLEARTIFGYEDGIDVFHSHMFHGIIDERFPVERNTIRTQAFTPLHLKKNVYSLGDILKPHRNLIVASKLKGAFEHLNHVALVPVHFSVLFSLEYRPRKWPEQARNYDHMQKWFEVIKHQPELEKRIGEFYEVVTDVYDKVVIGRSHLRVVRFRSVTYEDDVQLHLSRSLLEEFPVLWSSEGVLLSEQSFENVRAHVDWRYFCSTEIDLN